MMENEAFLEELLKRVTVSGCEEAGAEFVKSRMKDVADEIRCDEMGDTVCVLNPDSGFKILMTAHIDEIGLLVSSVNCKGRLTVIDRGGIVPATYPGHQVTVMTEKGPVNGVVESYRDFLKKTGVLRLRIF